MFGLCEEGWTKRPIHPILMETRIKMSASLLYLVDVAFVTPAGQNRPSSATLRVDW